MRKLGGPFSQLYVDLFGLVMRVEELSIKYHTGGRLTLGEMRTLEGIGLGQRRNMGELAGIMNVTVGTMTVAIDRLVKKGFVRRSRSEADRRVVWISLTREGSTMLRNHLRIHHRMVAEALEGLTEAQLEALDQAGNQIVAHFALEYSRLSEKQQAAKVNAPDKPIAAAAKSDTENNL